MLNFLARPSSNLLFFLLIFFVAIDKGFQIRKGNLVSRSESRDFALPEVSEIGIKKQSLEIVPEIFPSEEEVSTAGVYFLKFYGSGKQTHSRLVKVKREFRGGLKRRVKMALQYLEQGPSEEEAKRGLLSGLPNQFQFTKKIRFKEGILYISLPESFHLEAGREIMKDRLEQLSFTLFENPEIKGISLYINEKKVRFLGKDQYKVNDIITRSNRKIVIFR
jgi:spore germination protein GerM